MNLCNLFNNKSSGWGVGVKVGVSASGGAGVSVFANVNAAKGNADGKSVTHTETQITATDHLNLNAGRDLNMIGAQARGNSVDATVGRNLTITSEQDTSDYESRQKSMSAGVEIPVYGAGSASANLSMSKQKIDSSYTSVNEQSGLFAGTGGSNVNVAGHTQLNGGTIASTAPAELNNFSTGSLGFTDLQNHAEYEASSSGMGLSTGSLTTLATSALTSAIPANNGQSGESSSTTHASISAGNITIGGQAATAGQLDGLSRDTSDSANALKPIFDLQKVQDRMEMATVVGEIGALATNITATALQRAEQVVQDKALADVENKLTDDQKKEYNSQYYKDHPEEKANYLAKIDRENALAKNPEVAQLIDNLPKDMTAGDRQAVMDNLALKGLLGPLAQANQLYIEDQKKHGPGSPFASAAQALSGLAVGIAGGNVQQGLSNAAAPYLTGLVGGYFNDLETKNGGTSAEITAGRLLAHAAVGAAVAYASGGDAASGAAGAVAGEAMAMIVLKLNYPGLTADQLTNEQKEHIRAIATLASGLVGAATGNSFEAATTAAAAGYNATSNNLLRDNTPSPQDYDTMEEYQAALKKQLGELQAAKANCLDKGYSDCSRYSSQIAYLQVMSGFDPANFAGAGMVKGVLNSSAVKGIINNLATAVSTNGKEFKVQTLSALEDIYAKVSAGGSTVSTPTMNGVMKVLSDGTRVIFRNTSTLNGKPVVEIQNAAGKPISKVHLVD